MADETEPRRIHPEGHRVDDGRQILSMLFMAGMSDLGERRKTAGQSEIPEDIATWRRILASAKSAAIEKLKGLRTAIASQPKDQRKKLKQRVEREFNLVEAEAARIESALGEIADAAAVEIPTRLKNLYSVVQHQRGLLGAVPGRDIGTANWREASELSTHTSEKVALELSSAIERGRFSTPPRGLFPAAEISSRPEDDPEKFASAVLMFAELVHNQRPGAIPTEEEQRQLNEIAKRLGDPRSADGPRTAQLLGAILAAWLSSRRTDNSVSVTIDQLAERLRYEKHQSGGYRTRDLDEIRNYWITLTTVRLSSADGRRQGPLFAVNDYGSTVEDDEHAQELLTPDDLIRRSASARWTHLRVTPHESFVRLASSHSPMLMGRDENLNRLHPVNERHDLLLGRWLEEQFRLNWKQGRGLLTRRVDTLLAGADLPTDKPRIATLRRLVAALNKLEEEHGTLREWRDIDGRLDEILGTVGEENDLGYSPRMTPSRWRSALESKIELEAGVAYVKHQQAFASPKRRGSIEGQSWVSDLQQHLAQTGRSQAVVAEELGVTRSTLSRILSGKTRLSPAVAERIEAMLRRASTLELPLG